MSPYESFYSLLYSGAKQIEYLDKITELNTERRKIQEKLCTKAESIVNHEEMILIAHGDDFHEGVIGIVSGRLTEKHYKPSMVLKMEIEK